MGDYRSGGPAVQPLCATGGYIIVDPREVFRDAALVEDEPEDVARVALFLASDDAAYLNAVDIVVDGGQSVIV